MLTLLEVQNQALAPLAGEYLSRGSLKYEFGAEVLQTPIQLLKINNAQAQVPVPVCHKLSTLFDLLKGFVTIVLQVKYEMYSPYRLRRSCSIWWQTMQSWLMKMLH